MSGTLENMQRTEASELRIGNDQLGSTHGPFRMMRGVILSSGTQESYFRYGIVHGFHVPRLVAGIASDQSLMDLAMIIALAAKGLSCGDGMGDFGHQAGAWKIMRDVDGNRGLYLWINKTPTATEERWYRRWHFRPEKSMEDLEKVLGFLETLRLNVAPGV